MKTILGKIFHSPWWVKLLVLLLVAAGAWWIKTHYFTKPSVPPFRTTEVKRGDIADLVEASGPINPVNTTQVGALVSGEILKIYVDYNSEVKKGDLMAVIDQTWELFRREL